MDIRLSYIEKGEGSPLIMLHGNGERKEYFEHQIDFFADKFRVIAIDTRGHGASPRGTAPFTIVQFSEDLKDFMDEMNIEKANILGFSDGGNIALTFALKYQDRIEKLILNGANLWPDGMAEPGLSEIRSAYDRNKAKMKTNPEETFRIKRHEMLALMIEEPNISTEELKKLDLEVLVIAGTDDMILDEHTRLIAASIPGSRLEILPGDHFIANKEYDAFNRVVGDFLG